MAIVRYTAKFRTEGKLREQEEMFGMFFLLYMLLFLLCVTALQRLASERPSSP